MNLFLKHTLNDSWFSNHPEKIAGIEYETTSLLFPVQVKGTKEDVYRVTGISNLSNRAIAKAKARIRILKLKK